MKVYAWLIDLIPLSEKLPHGDDFRVGPKSDQRPWDITLFYWMLRNFRPFLWLKALLIQMEYKLKKVFDFCFDFFSRKWISHDQFFTCSDTALHDNGAAWHTLYHQSYTLQTPKCSANEVHRAAIGAPEMKHGLWERHLAKWARIEADSNVLWKSTYQLGYPVRPKIGSGDAAAGREQAEERKYLASQWRTQEGHLVIGNPHAEAQKEMDPSVNGRHEKVTNASDRTSAGATGIGRREKYNPTNRWLWMRLKNMKKWKSVSVFHGNVTYQIRKGLFIFVSFTKITGFFLTKRFLSCKSQHNCEHRRVLVNRRGVVVTRFIHADLLWRYAVGWSIPYNFTLGKRLFPSVTSQLLASLVLGRKIGILSRN